MVEQTYDTFGEYFLSVLRVLCGQRFSADRSLSLLVPQSLHQQAGDSRGQIPIDKTQTFPTALREVSSRTFRDSSAQVRELRLHASFSSRSLLEIEPLRVSRYK